LLSPLVRVAGIVFGAAKGAVLITLGTSVVRALTPPNALEKLCADSVLMQPVLEFTDDGRAAEAARTLGHPGLPAPSPPATGG
jgi:hypothetical protein